VGRSRTVRGVANRREIDTAQHASVRGVPQAPPNLERLGDALALECARWDLFDTFAVAEGA
jgi:hypothetical protein